MNIFSQSISQGPVFIILAAFLWSLDGFLRQNLYGLPSSIVVFLEHFLGFILLSPFLIAGWKDIKKLDRGTWGAIWWVVIWGGVLGTTFYTKALSHVQFISLSVVVLLQKLQPVFAISLAHVFLKEKLSKHFLRWAGVALVGGYLVSFPSLIPNFATGEKTAWAALLAVAAAFAWGSSTVFGKKSLEKVSFGTLSALRFGLTALVMGVVVLATKNAAMLELVTVEEWRYLVAIVFSTGAVALGIYYYGLRHTKASVATIAELFWPVSAVFLDLVIHGTILSATQWLGAGLLLGAIHQVSKTK